MCEFSICFVFFHRFESINSRLTPRFFIWMSFCPHHICILYSFSHIWYFRSYVFHLCLFLTPFSPQNCVSLVLHGSIFLLVRLFIYFECMYSLLFSIGFFNRTNINQPQAVGSPFPGSFSQPPAGPLILDFIDHFPKFYFNKLLIQQMVEFVELIGVEVIPSRSYQLQINPDHHT